MFIYFACGRAAFLAESHQYLVQVGNPEPGHGRHTYTVNG